MKLCIPIFLILLFSFTQSLGQCFPSYNKIVVVIGENTEANLVIGSSNAPYMNMLASQGALFTNSHGIGHPSQPNYLHLFSGSNQGMTTNDVPVSHFTTPNLAANLIYAGKSFISYSEELPSIGSDIAISGGYARKHNPVANWMGTDTNQVSPSLNQRLIDFPLDFNTLPDVSFVIPNQCHAGHDVCAPLNNAVKQFDAFVASLDDYKQWCINNNSLLIVTYDEGNTSQSSNLIYTAFYGAHVFPGQYNQNINHYNLLRTLEDLCGTAYAGASATATTIDYVWKSELSLNLKFLVEGYYSASPPHQRSPLYSSGLIATTNDIDTFQVSLMKAIAPFASAATCKGILQSDGNLLCSFNNIPCGDYYIQVRHKNILETWSKNPVHFSHDGTYDFSTSLSQAFDNGINLPMQHMGGGTYAFYSGDTNQDGSIDASDLGNIDNDNNIFAFGYNITDCSGDGATDASDMMIVENNSNLFLFFARPQ